MDQMDQRAEPAPQPGPWEGLLPRAKWPETLAVLLPVPGRVKRALGAGTRVWGERGLHLWAWGWGLQGA